MLAQVDAVFKELLSVYIHLFELNADIGSIFSQVLNRIELIILNLILNFLIHVLDAEKCLIVFTAAVNLLALFLRL